MKSLKPIFVVLLLFVSAATVAAQAVTWQMHHGQGAGIYVPPPGSPPLQEILTELNGNVQHGDPGGYQFADIPPEGDPGWEAAPVDPEDGELCFRLDRSRLEGPFAGLDFTYFQTTLTVTDPSIPFVIRYSQVDDGVRAYVFNSANPAGAFIEGGDARLYFTPKETDLSPLFVVGENRIVMVQYDDSQTQNYLKATVFYEGEVCDDAAEGPQLAGCPDTLTVTLDVCNQFIPELADFGVTATDNCTDSVMLTVGPELITDPGVNIVTITATDDAGISTICEVSVTTEANPEFITVTAEDDSLTVTSGQTLVITADQLLANDFASDGSTLEIQDLALVNPANGNLVDNGDGTYTYTPADGFTGQVQLTYIAKSADASLFFAGTGNFYEYVPAEDILWTDAKAAAEARMLNGVPGYLATVTSPEENAFIQSKLEGQGWMGASDLDEEGVWRWVTGPEAGTQFWQGGDDGMAVGGSYANWASGEPNNFMLGGNTAGEAYGHFLTNGQWNDYPIDGTGLINGYVVEYGGIDGCTPDFTDDATVTITVTEQLCEIAITGSSVSNVLCVDDSNGQVSIIVTGSENELEYSIDGVNFQENNAFSNLSVGTYTVIAREVENPNCSVNQELEVIASDAAPPVIQTPTETNFLVDAGECISAQTVGAVITDDCNFATRYLVDGVEVTFPFDFPLGSTPVIVEATDASGNVSLDTIDVTVGTAAPSGEDFAVNGNATLVDSTTTDGRICYRLTQDANNQFGTAWYQNKLNLEEDFSFSFSMNFGSRNSTGADGIAFVIQPVSTNEGELGGGIGYADISPSLVVEFDTYQNADPSSGDYSDPFDDHVAIQQNGNPDHGSSDALVAPMTLSNLEDGEDHLATVTWNAGTMTLTVVLDDAQVATYTGDIVSDIFSGDPGVFAGWTAATGGLTNEHTVCLDQVSFTEVIDSSSVVTSAPCDAENVLGSIDVEIIGGVPPYSYNWSTGATTEDLIDVPSGTYVLDVTDACGSTRTLTFELEEDCSDGATDQGNQLKLGVFPNPFQREANLSIVVPENDRLLIEVRDMNGKVVQSANLDALRDARNEFTLRRESLRTGLYLITVSSSTERRSIRAFIN